MIISTHLLRVAALSAACLVSSITVSAQVFSIDDGVSESSVGASDPGYDIAAINFFTGVAGTTQVTSIQIVFGCVPSASFTGISGGEAVTAYLWSDPNEDGNPSDALVLGSVAGTIATPNTDTFETFTLSSPVTLTTNNFFVGFIFTCNAQFPAGFDQSAPLSNRSYAAVGPAPVDPNNLGGAVYFNTMEGMGYPGNWMIRATAVPEPSACAACLGAAAIGLALLRRRGRKS